MNNVAVKSPYIDEAKMQDFYVVFSNDGEIEENAIKLLGASTKRENKNLIGQFGSGLTYSIAGMIREGISFKIFSGKEEMKITKKKVSLRDQDFDVLHINGKQTSITTEAGGVDWEAWFYILEEYVHKDTGLRDETRAMQNHLFNKYVELLETKSGVTL